MNSMTLIFFVAIAVVVVSAQGLIRPIVPILQHDEFRDEAGQFTLRYVTGDGTTITEAGKLVPNDEGNDYVLVKEGSYTFTAPEGQTFTVRYIADKNGFQPTGDHLPVAPTV